MCYQGLRRWAHSCSDAQLHPLCNLQQTHSCLSVCCLNFGATLIENWKQSTYHTFFESMQHHTFPSIWTSKISLMIIFLQHISKLAIARPLTRGINRFPEGNYHSVAHVNGGDGGMPSRSIPFPFGAHPVSGLFFLQVLTNDTIWRGHTAIPNIVGTEICMNCRECSLLTIYTPPSSLCQWTASCGFVSFLLLVHLAIWLHRVVDSHNLKILTNILKNI